MSEFGFVFFSPSTGTIHEITQNARTKLIPLSVCSWIALPGKEMSQKADTTTYRCRLSLGGLFGTSNLNQYHWRD